MTEKSGQNQAGRFQKGMSGNPIGKPKGARARVTQLAGKLLEDDLDDIVRAVIAAAKNGDLPPHPNLPHKVRAAFRPPR
jgi:Family of unknown function (DUF5681)